MKSTNLKILCFMLVLLLPKSATAQHIAVIGDSLAYPIAVQLQRLHPSVTVHRNSLAGTGLVYNYQTWQSQSQSFLRRYNPSITFVVLGTNDANNISPHIPFQSSRWNTTYANRVTFIINIALRYSNKVVWIGAPPMRNQNFSSRVQHLNTVVRQTIQSINNPNVVFFDCFMLFNNTFVPSFRASDGIHLSTSGARHIARNML